MSDTYNVDIKVLLESGAHFGHKTSRRHPKMAPFIHSKRGENHIIDLTKTVDQLEKNLPFIEQTVAQGRQVLFVGTKRQAQDIIKETATSLGQPYVTERWLGGMLTNTNTMNIQVKKLKDLEAKMASGELASKYNKLEVQRFQEQIDDMNKKFGGIKDMNGRPGVLFVVDIVKEDNAIKEAKKLGIPVVALVDTNADPSLVTHPVACNDDAIKAIIVVCDYVKEAVTRGQSAVAKKADKAEKTAESKKEEVKKD
jgi:small subunit ribosomal protein S2